MAPTFFASCIMFACSLISSLALLFIFYAKFAESGNSNPNRTALSIRHPGHRIYSIRARGGGESRSGGGPQDKPYILTGPHLIESSPYTQSSIERMIEDLRKAGMNQGDSMNAQNFNHHFARASSPMNVKG
jgi:hypothetical protein